MPRTGQAANQGDFKEYSNGGSDSTTWATDLAEWVQVIGAGTTVVTTEKGNNRTITTDSAEPAAMVHGPFSALVSTTATRVRMGIGAAPPITQVSPVAGPLAGTSQQEYANDPTVHTSAFSTVAGTMHKINPSGATFAYTFPAISAANNGMRLAVINVSTGTTATVAAPTGDDNIGNSAGTATGATAAGPTGGNTKTYVADNTQKAWLVGI